MCRLIHIVLQGNWPYLYILILKAILFYCKHKLNIYSLLQYNTNIYHQVKQVLFLMVNIHFFVICVSIMRWKGSDKRPLSLTILSDGHNYFMISTAYCTNAQLKLRQQLDNPSYLNKIFFWLSLILRYSLWLQKISMISQKIKSSYLVPLTDTET